MNQGERSVVVTELPTLARTYEIDGISVTVRGFLVNEHHPRYEIVLKGAGQIAIVDVPVHEHVGLEERVAQALAGFVAAIHSRNQPGHS